MTLYSPRKKQATAEMPADMVETFEKHIKTAGTTKNMALKTLITMFNTDRGLRREFRQRIGGAE